MNFRLYCLHSQQSLLIVAAIMFRLHSNSSLKLACSKLSDSGERCRVKKAMKSRGGLKFELYFALSPVVLFCPIFFFSLKFWFVLLVFVLRQFTAVVIKYTYNVCY